MIELVILIVQVALFIKKLNTCILSCLVGHGMSRRFHLVMIMLQLLAFILTIINTNLQLILASFSSGSFSEVRKFDHTVLAFGSLPVSVRELKLFP